MAKGDQAWLPPRAWRQQHKLAGDPMQQLDATQSRALYEFQRMLQQERLWADEHHDLYMLRRFLKARDWDSNKAKQMWTEMLAFRSNNRVDTILHEFHYHEREKVMAAYPHGLHKVDKEGHPVMIYKFGAVDIEALEKITNTQRLTQYHIQEYEKLIHCVLPACSVLAGRHIEKIVTLIDVAGVRMRDIGKVLDLLSTYIKVDANNYPETLAAMIIINAPMWFSGSFTLVKKMLSTETQKKIQILGSNYQSTLHSIIPPHNLLPEYGGTSNGKLGDAVGPWTAVLERLQAAEIAASAPPPPVLVTAKSLEAAGDAAGARLAGTDVRQRDDDGHVTAMSRREVSGSASQGRKSQAMAHAAQRASEFVLHPPETAVVQPPDSSMSAPQLVGHKHPLDDTPAQPALPAGGDGPVHRDVRLRRQGSGDHAQAASMQGSSNPQQPQNAGIQAASSSGTGPPHGSQGDSAPPRLQGTLSQTQQLDTITESAAMSHFSDTPLLSASGDFRTQLGAHSPQALDSFYSVSDSATWMPSDLATQLSQTPGQANKPHPQHKNQHMVGNPITESSTVSLLGAAQGVPQRTSTGALVSALTEDGLRSHESHDSTNAALYKSLDAALDAVSVVSFESARSMESVAVSAAGSHRACGSPTLGARAKGTSRSGSRKLSAGEAAGDSRRHSGRLTKWPSGSEQHGHHSQPQMPVNWEWDETEAQGAVPPAAMTAGAGARGMVPSFAAWGPGAPMMYAAPNAAGQPVFMPGMPLPQGYLPGMPAGAGSAAFQPLHSKATAHVNEYMRMWLQSAADMFHTAVKQPHPSASRQQLLEPGEVSMSQNLGPLDTFSNTPATQPSVGPERVASGELPPVLDIHTRAERIVAAGKAHHKRTRSGSTAPLRVMSLSDDPAQSPAAPAQQSMSDVHGPRVGSLVGGSGKVRPASYEVYVDSEDEESGSLLRRKPRSILPRYGLARTLLRRFCCCFGF